MCRDLQKSAVSSANQPFGAVCRPTSPCRASAAERAARPSPGRPEPRRLPQPLAHESYYSSRQSVDRTQCCQWCAYRNALSAQTSRAPTSDCHRAANSPPVDCSSLLFILLMMQCYRVCCSSMLASSADSRNSDSLMPTIMMPSNTQYQ